MSAVPPVLLEAIAGMQRVRPRRPWRRLIWLGLLLLGYAALPISLIRTRPDMPQLPRVWVAAIAFAWLLGFLLPLGAALLPRRGQVLPDGKRALRVALMTALGLIVVSLLFPKTTVGNWSPVPTVRNCLTFALVASVIPFSVALLASRRLWPLARWRLGAALGVSGAALVGLILHVLCPDSSAHHVALGHGGAVVLCGALGALVARQRGSRGNPPVTLRNPSARAA